MANYTVTDIQENKDGQSDTQGNEDVQEIIPQVDTLLSTEQGNLLSEYAKQLQNKYSSTNTPDLHVPDEDTLYATRSTTSTQNNNELKDSNIVTIHGQDYNKYDIEKSIKQVLSEASKYARWNHYSSAVSNDVWELYDALIDGSLEYTGRNFIDHRGRWKNEGKRIKDSSYKGGIGRGAAAYLLEEAIDRTNNYVAPDSTLLDFNEHDIYSELAPIFVQELGLTTNDSYEMFLELDELNKKTNSRPTTKRSEWTVQALKKCIDNLNTILKKYNIDTELQQIIHSKINDAINAFEDGDASNLDLMLLLALFGTAFNIKEAYKTNFGEIIESDEDPPEPKESEKIAIRSNGKNTEYYTIDNNLNEDLNFDEWMKRNGYTGETTNKKVLNVDDSNFKSNYKNFENMINQKNELKKYVREIVENYFSSVLDNVSQAETDLNKFYNALTAYFAIKNEDELLKYILTYATNNIYTEKNNKFNSFKNKQYIFSPNVHEGKMRILSINGNQFIIQQAPLYNITYAKEILRKVYDKRDNINNLLENQPSFWEKYS